MARIRTVKPEFWTDEKIVAMSPLARLFFIGLWNFVDDEGRAPYSPARLKMQILPADSVEVSEILGEIRRERLITVYETDGKEYFQVCGFSKHQKVDKRTASKHPEPPPHAELPRVVPTEGIKEGIKEGKQDAEPTARIEVSEPELFRRGKELCGPAAGGLIKNLLKAKKGSVALAMAAVHVASTKQDPREYLGAIIRGRDGVDEARLRGDAW